jgi:hypothetical protein
MRGLTERSRAKTARSDHNLYGSGLNRADWDALWNLVAPYLSPRAGKLVPPEEIDPSPLPEHLLDHAVAKLVAKYRATGKWRYLDRANRTLSPSSEGNVYGSGLNQADWYALRNLVDPYLNSRDGKLVPPEEIDPPPLPEHLVDHPVAKFVQKYRATGKTRYLDRAGETLVPFRDPRHRKQWYLVLTKS